MAYATVEDVEKRITRELTEDEESVFWTSTEYDVSGTKYVFEYAWIWAYRKDESVAWSNPHKYMGSYVRCIVDEKDLIENN